MRRKVPAVESDRDMPENLAKSCPSSGQFQSSHARYRALCGVFVLLIVAAGCGGGGNTLPGPSAGPSVYLTEGLGAGHTSSILVIPATANGTVSPTSILTGPAGVFFTGLAVDGAGNAYVGAETFGTGGGSGGPPLTSVEILAYAPGASGGSPTRTISSTSLQVNSGGINALAVDTAGNLYVSGILASLGSGIAVFSPSANGNVVPTKVIGGTATTIVDLAATPVAVDSAGNIYIPDGNPLAPESILIFNSSANGNVPPTSTLGGPATTLNFIGGLALDSDGNIYVSNGPNTPNALPEILEFSAGSTGNVAPIRTISGSATMIAPAGGNLALDEAGNIYLLNDLNILKFAPNATGNAAPIANITTTTSFVFSHSMAVH
jgi:hypothetical protein